MGGLGGGWGKGEGGKGERGKWRSGNLIKRTEMLFFL